MPWRCPAAYSAAAILAFAVVGCGKEPGTGGPGSSSSTAATASTAAATGTSAHSAATTGATVSPSSSPEARPTGGSGTACRVTDVKQSLVVGKLGTVPISTFASAASTLVGVGFVSEPTKAIGFGLDPATLQPRVSYTKPTKAPIRGVVPYPSGDTIAFAVNENDKDALQQNPVTIASTPAVTVRSFKTAVTIASGIGASPEVGWLLPSDQPVLAMAGAPVTGKGTMVVVQTADALRIGWLDTAGKPVGKLREVAHAGKSAATFGAAANGQDGLVLWRPGGGDATGPVRFVRAAFGGDVGQPETWTPPKGGPGVEWSLPTATGLDDGRWILVWAEGKPGDRQLTMQTYDAALRPIGEPVAVGGGKNALEGAAAVGSAGGVLVIRSADGGWDRVSAVGLDCS